MHPSALRALEYDRIVEAVTHFALTPMGADHLAKLTPSTDPHRVAQLLAATTETARFLNANGELPLHAPAELPHILVALAVEGRPLEALRLLALATFLDSIDDARGAIRRANGPFPILEAAIGGAASFKGETSSIREKIDPSGTVLDGASADLKTDPRSVAQAANAAAQHPRVVPPRQGHFQVPAGPGRHRAQRPVRARRAIRASLGHPGNRPRRLDERRQPVPRTAQHGRNQQRHRRARRAGSGGGPPDSAGAHQRVSRPGRRCASNDRSRNRARRDAGEGALFGIDRRHRARAFDRWRASSSRPRAIRCWSSRVGTVRWVSGGRWVEVRTCRARHDQGDPTVDRAADHGARTPAARPSP